jgi:hypothetical protein
LALRYQQQKHWMPPALMGLPDAVAAPALSEPPVVGQ